VNKKKQKNFVHWGPCRSSLNKIFTPLFSKSPCFPASGEQETCASQAAKWSGIKPQYAVLKHFLSFVAFAQQFCCKAAQSRRFVWLRRVLARRLPFRKYPGALGQLSRLFRDVSERLF
jgi:hypothetical protein